MRSDIVKKGLERAPHRSLLWATGQIKSPKDFDKAFIGICNSFIEIIPGHVHLNELGRVAKEAVREAGGVPFEFNTIGVDDGIAMGHEGMKYSLPSRELIADSLETVVKAHQFDGLICIPNCDKIVPGMLMAAMRLNIPAIVISGGPMLTGKFEGKEVDLIGVFEGVGRVARGEWTEARLKEMEECACPGCGSCAGMFTANSMNCLSEALGVSLPGNGTIPAVMAARMRLAKMAGIKVMELWKKNIRPRDIATLSAFKNAMAVDMALGCSTNTVLHLPAIAHEAKIKLDLDLFNKISDRTPHLCFLSPAGPHHLQDLEAAGGVPAVMSELDKLGVLDKRVMTATGKTLGRNLKGVKVKNYDVIKPIHDPYHKEGGIAILRGNLAPGGAVVKQSAVAPEMMVNEGQAIVFESEEDTMEAILKGKVKPGHIVVVRYEGPKGGPGMREMLSPTSAIVGMGLDKDVALITDGRFSGGSRGAAIGHISPEAAEGGLIALVKNGDRISIDIPQKKLTLLVGQEEIRRRRKNWKRPAPKIKSGYAARYAQLVTSAGTGAVLEEKI